MRKVYGEATLVSQHLKGMSTLLKSQLNGGSSLMSSQLVGSAMLIRSDDDIQRLSISPKYLWLTENNNYSGIFRVKSNVDWTIE